MSLTETLTWTPASQPPDADMTVILFFADGDWSSGWWDADCWIDTASGGQVDGVTHWANPQGPTP